MSFSFSRTLLVAVPALLLTVAAHAQPVAGRGDSVTIALNDLDLSSPSGRAAAQARIRHAAEAVCVPTADVIPEEVQECVHVATRSAANELDRNIEAAAIARVDTDRGFGAPVVAALNAR